MPKLHFLHPQHLLFSGIYSDVQHQYSCAHKLWQIQYIISAPADSLQLCCPCCGINATQLEDLPWACPCNIWLAYLAVIRCILNGHIERALSSIYPTYALNAHASTTKLEGSLVQCLIFYCEFNFTLAIISAKYPPWGLYCSANQLAEINWKSLCLVMDTEWFSCNKEFS